MQVPFGNRAVGKEGLIMSDTSSAPARPPGRVHRLLRWMRDYDSQKAREYYVRFGVWSSRFYAVVLFGVVYADSWLASHGMHDAALWLTLAWCVLWTHIYFWYQGKEIIAYPVVEEDHANRDLMNSILPVMSVAIIVGGWVLTWALYSLHVATVEFSYSEFGWIVIGNAFLDVLYDLRVNTKVTFILSKVPGRQEFGAPQPPRQ